MLTVHIWRPLLILLLALVPATNSPAEEPNSRPPQAANWPQQVLVTVGDIRTRIDGPKLWTLSGIDFQNAVMATEDSAYGSVLTIRNVGLLGTAHFLDVPGQPGKVEKEQVDHLRFLVDGQPVSKFTPRMTLTGQTFRMERKSRIRTVELESSVSIADGVLIETASFHATGPTDLRVAYPWMYALTHESTVYVCGDKTGIRQRGTFQTEGKTATQVIDKSNWIAVFNPSTGKGCVCCSLKHPPSTESSFLLVDAPGIYHKVAAYTLVDTVLPTGFQGTFQSALGFFTATQSNWETLAQHRATEIRASHPN
jgi:hypothetical protein